MQRRSLVLVPFTGHLLAALPQHVKLVAPEPHDVLPVLQAEPQMRALPIAVFWGHAVWSSMQLVSEVMRGNWGLSRASSEDLLLASRHVSGRERSTVWREL